MVSHRPAVFELVKKVIIAVSMLNPLKCSGVRHLHLNVFSAIQVLLTFFISDIRALSPERQSAEYQKLKCRLDLDGKV